MLPDGWESTTLGEIMDFRNGLNFSKSDSKNLIKVVGVSDFSLGNVLSRTDSLKETYVDQFKNDDLLQENDFLFVRSNGNKSLIGRCLYFPHIPEPISFSGFTIRGRLKNPSISATYIFQIVAGEYFRKYINLSGSGTNISNLSQEILYNTQLILPPLPEQKKIAAILSTWDRAIEGTEKLLANSQQQKKALMQQLLTGKKRLPGFMGEWKKHRLSDFFVRLMQRNTSGNTNVVTISAQDGLVKQEEYFKKTVASETLDGYFLLENGDFAYNKSYSIGYPMGAIKRLNRYEKGVVTTLYICFRLKSHQFANGDFFEFYFDSGLMNYGLTQIAHEGGRAHGLLNVKPADFMHLQVTVPSVDEQEAIAAVLTRANEEITAIEADLSHLRQEKKALMQQLLTGKRRVKVD
ncbi:restriction endonuclease subunit S [Komagataeibacter sp. FXV3]|uniref:restriction endonuclease subunit S n=1 Tax=Komagataeibacter sp. FXV3 TaxID=2608998 RepID=UPI00187B6F67|nr:restriction endonuclease subunit S [Komagataeibacter sp. FXV3]MBE7730610.1 restriction endonuclease subunit S [Komagataeibacter sp. FXV3]